MAAIPRELPREELELRAFKAKQISEDLRELAKTDGWKVLQEVFEAAEKSYYSTVTRQLMQGREINQRKLDFNRGMFEGVKQLLAQPDKAEAVLGKALERLADAAEKE